MAVSENESHEESYDREGEDTDHGHCVDELVLFGDLSVHGPQSGSAYITSTDSERPPSSNKSDDRMPYRGGEKDMRTKVLFVCYGNICRSPLAEFIFKDMVGKAGLDDSIDAASCATSADHIGDPVDPRSAAELSKHGISCAGKTARRLTRSDFADYDYIIGMDRRNLEYIRTLAPSKDCCVMDMLMNYAGGGEVADPWYTGDFARAYRDVEKGCRGLLEHIIASRGCGR